MEDYKCTCICDVCCGSNTGAYKKERTWVIPSEAERPIDKRVNSEKKENHKFTFKDLFAGIGGFHQAMRYLGGKCIMASEINACKKDLMKTAETCNNKSIIK